MILTPICSHSVFTRSLVLGEDSVLRIYSDDGGPICVSCDGDEPFTRVGAGEYNRRKSGHLRRFYKT